MLDFDRSPWHNVDETLALFRYNTEFEGTGAAVPVLMLHGPMTSHRTWDTLATYLCANGMDNIYAVDIDDAYMTGALQKDAIYFIGEVVRWLVEHHPEEKQLVFIGHSTGGVLARRYLHRGEYNDRIAYLFSLASPHQQTYFSHIVYVPPEDEATDGSMSYVRTADIPPKTFLVNIFGSKLGAGFDGTIRGVYLPEAVNYVANTGHSEIKYNNDVLTEILACLRGKRLRLQLYLDSLSMKVADLDGRAGPFYFEIDGKRSPFDGVFQAVVDHQYQFDESNTPLFTLAYPIDQTSCTLVFRLKDRSRTRTVRRRLFAKILVALQDGQTVLHEMQDSEGSSVTLRLRCQQMPALIGTL